jgi:transcription elongation factor GreA
LFYHQSWREIFGEVRDLNKNFNKRNFKNLLQTGGFSPLCPTLQSKQFRAEIKKPQPTRGVAERGMSEQNKFYLTKEGLERFKKEYQTLKKLRLLKAEGEAPRTWESEDLNPEYLSFQEDLNLFESKISDLEHILKNAELIKPPSKDKQNIVDLGAKVTTELDGEVDEFVIVGTLEADPSNYKISDKSPIGQALLGKKIGETVVIKTPIVNHSCKIIKIKYDKA